MIQIIEDDLITCQIIAALLKRMCYASCQAHTGAKAMEQLRTLPIDLVIADMMLPDMLGLELLEQKYNLPYVKDIPVLCCTAHADIETVEAAMGFGAVDFVRKPIVIQAFAARINRAVERAPVRWESRGEMSKRLPFYGRTIEPMFLIAQQVLRELDCVLEQAQDGVVSVNDINAMVVRARGAAQNVGAIRTVRQIDYLWTGTGISEEIAYLRAALVIELAGFEEAIQSRAAADEPVLSVVG